MKYVYNDDFTLVIIGDHAFFINLEFNNAYQTDVHGQFFLNSNAMDIDIQPLPALTYTTTGGIIDLYIFTGPTVQNVVEQYWDIIGVSSNYTEKQFVFQY